MQSPAPSTYDAASRTATFNPGAALTPPTTYSVTVSGAKDSAGNTMATVTLDLHHRASGRQLSLHHLGRARRLRPSAPTRTRRPSTSE